jgi:hypothetical protein
MIIIIIIFMFTDICMMSLFLGSFVIGHYFIKLAC